MKRRAAIAIAAASILATRGALAEPAARLVYLRGKGTESCADEVDLRAAVRARLGYDPFNSFAASTMFAEVATNESGFVATLKLVDPDNSVRGDRTLKTTGACSELTEAMALTISLAIDPMSVTRNGPPPDAPPEERSVDTGRTSEPPPPPDAPPPAETPRSPPAKKDKPILALSLGPYASLGSAPAFSLGAAVGADVHYKLAFGGLEARGELPASAAANTLGRVSSHMYAGSIFGGVRQGIIFVGAIVQVGATLATSTDTATARPKTDPWIAPGLRLGAAIPFAERFELRVRADVLANVDRTTLAISGQKAYEFPAVSGDLGIAFAVRFP